MIQFTNEIVDKLAKKLKIDPEDIEEMILDGTMGHLNLQGDLEFLEGLNI